MGPTTTINCFGLDFWELTHGRFFLSNINLTVAKLCLYFKLLEQLDLAMLRMLLQYFLDHLKHFSVIFNLVTMLLTSLLTSIKLLPLGTTNCSMFTQSLKLPSLKVIY